MTFLEKFDKDNCAYKENHGIRKAFIGALTYAKALSPRGSTLIGLSEGSHPTIGGHIILARKLCENFSINCIK